MSGEPRKLDDGVARPPAQRWTCLLKRAVDLWVLLCFVGIAWLLSGCDDQVRRPSAEDLAEFEMAAPSGPSVDMDRVVKAKIPTGPYRVVPGDILQLEMPRILDPQSLDGSAAMDGNQRYNFRVNDAGIVVLPIIGPLAVGGSSLTEIESSVMAAYYPRYVKTPLPVYVSVVEYSTRRVSIVGAVARPGIYSLRHDQMSLVALLMEAGGIIERGAAVIRITRTTPASTRLPAVPVSTAAQGKGRHSEPKQIVHMASWEPASGARPRAAREVEANTLVFDWEGPLNTAGWLTFEDSGSVRIRKYVDLGNEFQRMAFLGTVATESRQVPIDELRARMIELMRHLEGASPAHDARFRTKVTGWETTDGRHFEASLNDWVDIDAGSVRESAVATADVAEDITGLALPVKGLNIPFVDAALQEGDSVVVESPVEQFISVLGLVNRPGNMPYPADAQYNLIQAIAFAGGLDLVADPRYVSVYRLRPNGDVANATFQLVDPEDRERLTQSLALPLRPGDVVSVEHTPRTRTNVFLERVFQVSLGLYLRPGDLWEND